MNLRKSLLFLLLAGLMLLQSCVEEFDADNTKVKTYTMSIVAGKGGNGTVNSTWKAGDKVTVYNKTRNAELEGYLMAWEDGATTTLKGTLSGIVKPDEILTLRFLDSDYSEQDGTLRYIASHCDYSTADVTVKSVKKGNITATRQADFASLQAVVEFTLQESDGSAIAGGVNNLAVVAGGTTITVKPASATDVFYVAIPAISNETLILSAVDRNGVPRSYTDTGVTFENGKYYGLSVRMDCIAMNDGDLIAAIASGVPEIVLGGDLKLMGPDYVTIIGSLTIDLNGHSISGHDTGNRIFCVDKGKSLTLNGPGSIKDGHADEGGAILNRGDLIINDVSFTGCSAISGGAVFNDAGASLTLSNVTFSGNRAGQGASGSKSAHGGAIYNEGTLNMSGAIVAADNTGENGKPDNVYLAESRVINVTGAFTVGAAVGVTLEGGTGYITSGYSAYSGSIAPDSVFSSDEAVFQVMLHDGEAAVRCYYNVTAEKTYASQQALLDETGYDLSGVQTMLSILFPDRSNPARAISFTYRSADPQGYPVELSALLYVPDAALDGARDLTGICLTNHGTIASNAECPTNRAQFEGALAWKNYAIVMPDYYGFGASADRPQAYLDAETTARGNIDAYLAAVQLLKDREVRIPDKLHSFGYSQGGFNSMANLKYVSKHPELHVSFEKVMCGGSPFDVELTWNEYTRGTFRNAIAFVPMSVVSMNESQQLGIRYDALFKGSLLDNWRDWILSKKYSLGAINAKLGTNDLSAIMNDEFMTGTGEAYHTILNVCRRYSLTSGWVPPAGTRIILYHSRQDDTVPYSNLKAMKEFLDNVAPGSYTAKDGNDGGHVEAVIRFVMAVIPEW